MILWILLLSLASMAGLFAAGIGEASVWLSLVSATPEGSPFARLIAAIVGLALGAFALIRLARSPGQAVAPAPLGWRWTLGIGAGVFALAVIEIRELANVIAIPTDFGTYIHAAEELARGRDPYAATGGTYFYPPPFLFWIRPLTWIPIAGASVLWFHAKLAILVLLVRWTVSLLEGGRLRPQVRSWFVVGMLALSARFVLADLQYGNTNLVVAFLITGSVYFDLVRPSRRAGALAAAAAMIKVVPAVFLAWGFARRRFMATGIAVATLSFLCIVPWIFEASNTAASWTSYLDVGVQGKLGDDLGRVTNQSMLGFALRALPDHPQLARILWGTLSGLLIGFGMAMASRHRRSDRLTQAIGAAYLAGCLIVVSPGSWVVHYTGAFLPLAALLRLALQAGPRRRVYGSMLGLVFLATTASGWFRPTIAPSLQGSWFLISLLLVLAALAFELATRPPVRDQT